MKNVNINFKNNIKQYGRQLYCKITTTAGASIYKENINYIKPSFNTGLFKSVMCVLEIDSNVELKKGTKFDAEVGIAFNDSAYDTITYKNYTVHKCERLEDTESYRIIAYDKMLDAMKEFDLDINERLTVKQYITRIFNKLGWALSGIPSTFINANKYIEPRIHKDIDYTYRDVLDEISTVTGAFICVVNGVPMLKYITDTNEKVDDEYLSQDDVTISKKYFINSLVFSRAEESDNIFRKDDESIIENGLHEFRISDNQILSTLDRDTFIDELWNYLKNLEFYIFEVKSTGIMWFDVADRFYLEARGHQYSTILLNDEITIDQDIEEKLYTDEPAETVTEYKYGDETDRKINKTYILVDKQNQKIEQLVNKNTEFETKQSLQQQDIDSIKAQVDNTIEYKREAEGYTEVHLQNAGALDILHLEIDGNKTYEANLFPGDDLFPGNFLQPNMRR